MLALGLAQAPDAALWQRAARERAIIISKDEDFARMTLLHPEAVTVIWLRVGNCRTQSLLATMERTWPAIIQQLEGGARLIEVH